MSASALRDGAEAEAAEARQRRAEEARALAALVAPLALRWLRVEHTDAAHLAPLLDQVEEACVVTESARAHSYFLS